MLILNSGILSTYGDIKALEKLGTDTKGGFIHNVQVKKKKRKIGARETTGLSLE